MSTLKVSPPGRISGFRAAAAWVFALAASTHANFASAEIVADRRLSSGSLTVPAARGRLSFEARWDSEKRVLSLSSVGKSGPDTTLVELPLPDVSKHELLVRTLEGANFLHGTFTSKSGATFEILARGAETGATTSRQPVIIWAGRTGIGGSSEGERLTIHRDGSVDLGALREGVTLCGQKETMLSPRRLDAATMLFRPVSLLRRTEAERAKALLAKVSKLDKKPLISVLGLAGASTNEGGAPALVDDDATSVWHETRRGDGRGEFLVFSATKEVPLKSIVLTLPATGFVRPRHLFLAVDDLLFRLELPNEGGSFAVELPKPTAASCVSLELDEAWDREPDAKVAIAEVEGVPELPDSVKSLDDLVSYLDGEAGPQSFGKRILGYGGAKSAKAIGARLGSLGERGKLAAIEVLSLSPCREAAVGLSRLAWNAPPRAVREAKAVLDRCDESAFPAVLAEFLSGPLTAKEALGERLARYRPAEALDSLMTVSLKLAPSERWAVRPALARVSRTTKGRSAMASWLATHPGVEGPLELARAVFDQESLGELASTLSSRLARDAGEGAPFSVRFLSAPTMAAFAARGDAAAGAFLTTLMNSKDRELRARAAEVTTSLEHLSSLIVLAREAEPRVREKATFALGRLAGTGESLGGKRPLAAPALNDVVLPMLEQRLTTDGWTFVRVAAAEGLGQVERTAAVDSRIALMLAKSVATDPSPALRLAAVRALLARDARSAVSVVRARAFDDDETTDVRRLSLEGLGLLCDVGATAKLVKLVEQGSHPGGRLELAMAALRGLGSLQPSDLRERLRAVDTSSPLLREAVRRALSTPSACSSAKVDKAK